LEGKRSPLYWWSAPAPSVCSLPYVSRAVASPSESSMNSGVRRRIALHPASVALLETMGLREEVLAHALHVTRMSFFDGTDCRATLDLRHLDVDHPFLAILRQDRLEEILERTLNDAGVTVEWNNRLARFTQHADHVEVTLHQLGKDSVGYAVAHTEWVIEHETRAKVPFVIGADGRRSLVRRQLEIEFPEVREPQHFAVFEFKTNADLDGEVRVMLHDDSTSVVWPLPNGYCRFSFEVRDATVQESWEGKDRLLVSTMNLPVLEPETLEALLRERAPWFRGDIEDLRWCVAVQFETHLTESFGQRRMWLAGDAGHTAGPVGVQSMNVGLREAADLAQRISRILHDEETATQELEEYGAERSSEWKRLLGLTSHLVPGAGASDWVRAHAPRIFPCLPGSGEALTQLASQLGLELS
jgi:2-polyprenyl-6-methoxyphenol hydroxylase-like FAD-dependent oxidoreductase